MRAISIARIAIACLVAALTSGCATVYQPRGLSGGYTDTRISDTNYVVEFRGNGKTSSDTVWNFWLYRCAELTQQKGFDHFALVPKSIVFIENDVRLAVEPSSISPRAQSDESLRDEASQSLTLIKGGGGGAKGGGVVYVPGYGGGTITTWRSSAEIHMYRQGSANEPLVGMNASAVLLALKPFVASQGRSITPSRHDLIAAALTLSVPAGQIGPALLPGRLGESDPTPMQDLEGLLQQ
ncbi:hypothetical protein QN397_25090 [Variovorax sp. RTB1]|jgi:hypothetical protein|uniref:CC0125/CC1285 family lipoprotein n=1 Tax=Variovorax sp. RTB1 TaxID=3048631 RepID=UPI002B22C289|nr:hypothetical protein [Variovorax sp. RTB1]MEB0114558.1 hypothetical protein [Variovorax sp. RTB1]